MPGSKRLQADLSGIFSNKETGRGQLLFLLRHGQIPGQETRRFIGRTDIALDETGRDQARAWQTPFSSTPFGQVYTSGLTRCRQTAALALPVRTVIVDERLNEINLGAWDGHSFNRIKTTNPERFKHRGKNIYGFRPPGGESFKDLFTRVSAFFDELSLSSPTLVITHAGVIRVMLCHWAGKRMDQLLTFKTQYGQLFVLETPKPYFGRFNSCA